MLEYHFLMEKSSDENSSSSPFLNKKISTHDYAVRTQKTQIKKQILIMILTRYNTNYRCKSVILTFELDKQQKVA